MFCKNAGMCGWAVVTTQKQCLPKLDSSRGDHEPNQCREGLVATDQDVVQLISAHLRDIFRKLEKVSVGKTAVPRPTIP